MEDIRVMREGRYYIVESSYDNMKFNVEETDESAEELGVEPENVAIIRAIMNQKIYRHRTTWKDIVKTFEKILTVVPTEFVISYMLEAPDYIINDPDILLDNVLREYGL